MRKRYTVVAVVFCVLVAWSFLTPCMAEEVKRITKEELKNMLSDPSVVVVDVRKEADWKASEFKIKGAVREDPGQVASWMGKYAKDKTLVFYCAWTNEYTSARVAAEFIKAGYSKVWVLKGGWNEWARDKYPMEPK